MLTPSPHKDLQEADRFGNVQKAKDLRFKMHATFSPSEYIIWGGVKPSVWVRQTSTAFLMAFRQLFR